jgi:hypothetical protein
MRFSGRRLAGVAVLAALAAILLGGCELREGDPREYGANTTAAEILNQNPAES